MFENNLEDPHCWDGKKAASRDNNIDTQGRNQGEQDSKNESSRNKD